MLPVCLFDTALATGDPTCTGTCLTDKQAYLLAKWPSSKKTLTPIGIAKDGHIIWGPYKKNGKLWSAYELDVCNGAVIDGVYGYAATHFHPYVIGCWGPGSATNF